MKWLLPLASILLASVSAAQITVAPPPIELRMSQASQVCICALIGPARPANRYDLVVIQGYKHAAKREIIHASSPGASVRLVPAIRYLLFLGDRVDSGSWPILGAVPVPSDFPVNSSAQEGSSLQVDMDIYLHDEYTRGADSDVLSMIKLLDEFQNLSPESVSLLEDLATGKRNNVALWSESLLLKRGIDASTLFGEYLERLEAVPGREIPFTGSAEFIFTQYAVRSETGDFEKLSHSENAEIRHAALLAVKKVADKSTTAFLISEMDAPDLYDEYIAISTLADLYGKTGEYGPGIGEFERDRGRYVQLWKAWFRAGAN